MPKSPSHAHDHSHDHSPGHAHGHADGHGHAHSHAPKDFGRAFAIGITLNTIFVAIEAGYGYASNSMALVADAGHNLSDVLGLIVAWIGARLATKPPTERYTFGLRGASILAALANAMLLIVALALIVWEAAQRLAAPEPVATTTMMVVAGIGIVVNAATALLFFGGREHDINIRGAYLHMAADAGVSLGVVIAGLAIGFTGWSWLDPVTSLLIAGVIFVGTWSLLRESFDMAINAVPSHLDLAEIRATLLAVPGVTGVHDLHVWPMSTTEAALTAHLVAPQGGGDALLAQAAEELREHHGLKHVTLQVETNHGLCATGAADSPA